MRKPSTLRQIILSLFPKPRTSVILLLQSLPYLSSRTTYLSSSFINLERSCLLESVKLAIQFTLVPSRFGSYHLKKQMRFRRTLRPWPACEFLTEWLTCSQLALTVCFVSLTWKTETHGEMQKALKAFWISLKKFSQIEMKSSNCKQKKSSLTLRPSTRKTPIWKWTSSWMLNPSRAQLLKRRTNLCRRASKLRTRSSLSFDRSKNPRTPKRSNVESFWTSSKIRLSKRETSTLVVCLMTPKNSPDCKLRKKENTKTS